MTARRLSETFREWTKTGNPLVLASVYETDGSTYSKAGAQMLITQDGTFQGMLSGGCLEGDLAVRAEEVARNGMPQCVTYDLRAEDDDLWGLGVGCEGMIRVFLQRLDKGNDYEPFSSMVTALEGTGLQLAMTVVASEIPKLPPGSALVLNEGITAWSDIAEPYQQQLAGTIESGLSENHSSIKTLEAGGKSCSLLVGVLRPYPRVLVLGAGMDAEPLVRMISELGWRATVTDHRPAYIENGDFSRAEKVLCIPADAIAAGLELDQFDAAIVMSHHLVTDATYLATLAGGRIPYIGLLGPPHRRDRLLLDLGSAGDALEGRLYGPAGLDINASGPASIALSIVAQIHRKITTY